jgi:hypothetical protein
MADVPKLEVKQEAGKFRITDERDTNYGSYDTKKQAEENAELWGEYYKAPLVF